MAFRVRRAFAEAKTHRDVICGGSSNGGGGGEGRGSHAELVSVSKQMAQWLRP